MMTELKRFANRHKYSIFIFVFMFVYNFVVVREFSLSEIDDITYTYHIVDYTIGFCTKLLPGAIYNAIFPTTQAAVVNIYFFVIYHIFLLAVSLIAEIFIKRFNDKDRVTAFIMIMFFITGPATFSIHTVRLGMLDTYWLFFSVLFIVAIQNKVLKWFVPILFASSLLIHISAMVSFVPFFALIVLLEATNKKENRKSYLTVFGISILTAVIFFAYLVINEESNLVMSPEEFRAFISERNLSEWLDYTTYYDYALYRISYVDGVSDISKAVLLEGDSFISGVINAVWVQVNETFRAYRQMSSYYVEVLNDIVVCIPAIILLYKHLLQQIKESRSDKLRLFTWVCSLFLLPLIFISGALCSPDITRWFGHSFIVLFTLVMYNMYRSGSVGLLKKDYESNKFGVVATVIYFMLYMTCIVDPYC